MQHSKTNPTSTEQPDNRESSQQISSGQVEDGAAHHDSGPAQPRPDGSRSEKTKDHDRDENDASAPEPAPAQPANAKQDSDRSNENQDANSSGSGGRKENAEGAERSRPAGSRGSNYLMLNNQTQQTIMEIIQTLRNNATPDAAEQLFKTLTETSEEIERSQVLPAEEVKEEVEAESPEKKPASVLSIEDQLKLLLDKLNSNSKLKHQSQQFAQPSSGNSGAQAAGKRRESGQTSNSQGGPGGASASAPGSAQLITQAYHLINSVIMYPQIMWTRNFFYSLGAMAPQQQQIMHDWFIEMNEKQQIYIKEIERANDQLKETAASMFSEKGFSREQTDLFLKKVNFMENREYFFHKRRSMASRANAKDDDREGSRDSSNDENQENARAKQDQNLGPKPKTFNNQYVKSERKKSDGRNFFDKLSSSCKLDDEQVDTSGYKGQKDLASNATSERRFRNYDRGGRQGQYGYNNERTSPYKQTNLHQRQFNPRAGRNPQAQDEDEVVRSRGQRLCNKYSVNGYCPYGEKCQFIHAKDSKMPSSGENSPRYHENRGPAFRQNQY